MPKAFTSSGLSRLFRFYNYSSASLDSGNTLELCRDMRITAHAIEKGMALPSVKKGFGKEKIKKLLSLMDKYIEELRRYLPVIVLTVEQGNAFKAFHRNEKKHRMRMLRTYELNGYIEGWTEEEHICKYSCDELDMIENYLGMARSAKDAGNNTEAEAYCNKVIEIDPNNYKAWMIKGRTIS